MTTCQWCKRRRAPRGAKYCSHACRQRAYEYRRVLEQEMDALDGAIRHAQTVAGMLRAGLIDRHFIRPRVQEVAENAQ